MSQSPEYPSQSPTQHSFAHRAEAFVVAAALIGGGLYVNHEIKTHDACELQWLRGDHSGAIECALGDGFGNQSTPSDISKINLKSETLINKQLTVSFGEIAMDMSGTATFNYNYMIHPCIRHLPCPPAYNSIVYNKDDAKTTEIVAMPCFTFGDYQTALNPDAASDESADKSQVKVDVALSPGGKSISSINIHAGRLDYCLPHVAQTIDNQDLWGEGDIHVGEFGALERAYYVQAMDTLLTDASMAQACPENMLNMNKVKQVLGLLVKGSLGSTPAQAAMVETAYEDNKVHVDIEPASERLSHYRAIYEQDRTMYISEKNAPKHTRMEPMEISDIKVASCNLKGALPLPAN